MFDLHKRLLEYKKFVAEDQEQVRSKQSNRPKGIWTPEYVLNGEGKGSSKSETRVFGVELTELVKRDGHLPVFVDKAIAHLLKTDGVQAEGIFRVSAPKPMLDSLQETLDTGGDIDFASMSPHDACGLLKLFLREIPSPLCTFELYQDFLAVASEPSAEEPTSKLKKALAKLPKPNYDFLHKLLALCVRIEKYQEKNKMNFANLSVVLCPSLLYDPEPNPLTMVEDISKANSIMVLMLKQYVAIFGEQQIEDLVDTTAAPPKKEKKRKR